MRQELSELREAFKSIKDGSDTPRSQVEAPTPKPLGGKTKRKATHPVPISETEEEDLEDNEAEEMGDGEAPPKTKKVRIAARLATRDRTLAKIMELITNLDARVGQLERPKVKAKAAAASAVQGVNSGSPRTGYIWVPAVNPWYHNGCER